VISATLYKRWGAKPRLSTEKYIGPTILPFFGGLMEMANFQKEAHDLVLRMARNANFQTIEVPVPMASFVILMDARDREYILKTRENDPRSSEHIFSELLGRGIFATDKSEWLESRKIASHMFSGHALRTQMEHVFNRHADHVIELLTKHAAGKVQPVDIQEIY